MNAQELLDRARKEPGVADLIKLYRQHAETVRSAEPYVRQPSRLTIFSTGSATA
jgi:hypothetical protein